MTVEEYYKDMEAIDASYIEKKTKEISEKWKSRIQEQSDGNFYKFYRKHQFELFEDFEQLWLLYKLEELKSEYFKEG